MNKAHHNCSENIVNSSLELFIICGASVMKINGEKRYGVTKSTTSILCNEVLIPPNPKSVSYNSIKLF